MISCRLRELLKVGAVGRSLQPLVLVLALALSACATKEEVAARGDTELAHFQDLAIVQPVGAVLWEHTSSQEYPARKTGRDGFSIGDWGSHNTLFINNYVIVVPESALPSGATATEVEAIEVGLQCEVDAALEAMQVELIALGAVAAEPRWEAQRKQCATDCRFLVLHVAENTLEFQISVDRSTTGPLTEPPERRLWMEVEIEVVDRWPDRLTVVDAGS